MKPKKCEHTDCNKQAEFKAPKSRIDPHDYVWFCLGHIREYNSKWDYYAGMNEDEIENDRKHDKIGRRPTWKLNPKTNKFKDPFGYEDFFQATKTTPLKGADKKALDLLELEYPFTEKELKRSYNKKVKEYHPDLNQGSKECEEKLKKINDAYQRLKSHITPNPANSA